MKCYRLIIDLCLFIQLSFFSGFIFSSDLLNYLYNEEVLQFYADFQITSENEAFPDEQGSIFYLSDSEALHLNIGSPMTHEVLVTRDCLSLNDLAIEQLSIHLNQEILPEIFNFLFFDFKHDDDRFSLEHDSNNNINIKFNTSYDGVDYVLLQKNSSKLVVSFFYSNGNVGDLTLNTLINSTAIDFPENFIQQSELTSVIDTTDGLCR